MVDQVKARLDIVDVVSDRVALKKAGKMMKGLCPFHVEKTPSFIVFPETGTWKCFGCGAGGDMFTFVMNSQGLDFAGALALLAGRAGVELRAEPREKRVVEVEDRLHAANEAAAAYFQSMLAGPAGSRVRAYLEERGISGESVETFRIGFAPDGGAGLSHHLLQKGFGREDLLLAGLVGQNESGGLYDRFRGRLIFPIWDLDGKLVGFGGRSVTPDTHPKYLNTPQTPIFDKGGCLYAVHLARKEIRGTGQAVIVEGYVDALMAHQHGFRNVVASLGTAVTERQLSMLKRWASELCFALDPDVAGQEATARGLEVAMGTMEHTATPVPTWKGFVEYVYKLKTAIKIIALPQGFDPDDVLRRDPAEWQRLVREAVPVQDFFLERVRRKHDLSTAAGKSAAVAEAMAVIGQIPDPVQQAHYIQRLAALVGMEESVLLHQARLGTQQRRAKASATTEVARAPQSVDLEGYCLALVVKDPSLLRAEPELAPEHFSDPAYREVFKLLLEYAEAGKGNTGVPEIHDWLRDRLQEPLGESLEQLLELRNRHPAQFEEPLEKAFRSAAVKLMLASISLRRQQIDEMLAQRDQDLDPEETARLSRIEMEVAQLAHRLKLLGGTLPLRTIHKEVRHGR